MKNYDLEVTVEQIKELIDARNGTPVNIVSIYKTGSETLGRENSSDTDIWVYCEGMKENFFKVFFPKEELSKHLDIMVYNIDYQKKLFNFDIGDRRQIYNYFYYYNELIYGGDELVFDIFNYEAQYKKVVKEYMERLEVFYRYMTNKSNAPVQKHFTHIYLITKIFENKSTELTDEMKNAIKNFYNKEGFDELLWLVSYYEPDNIQLKEKIEQNRLSRG